MFESMEEYLVLNQGLMDSISIWTGTQRTIVKLLAGILILTWWDKSLEIYKVLLHVSQNDHAAPTSELRHAGDLGNIITPPDSYLTFFEIVDTVITLGDGGDRDVANRAIVVHAGEDDLGLGVGDAAEGSKKTGNAGGRVACGIIKLQNWPC